LDVGESTHFDFTRVFGEVRQVNSLELERDVRRDELSRLSVLFGEDRAQSRVPPDHLAQAPLQRLNVEAAREAHAAGDVVEGVAGLQLVEKPEALLRVRERRRHFVRALRY